MTRSNESTVENTPEFLPSDNEDSDEEVERDSTRPGYVASHFPTFPSKHSFRQTPVNFIHVASYTRNVTLL